MSKNIYEKEKFFSGINDEAVNSLSLSPSTPPLSLVNQIMFV